MNSSDGGDQLNCVDCGAEFTFTERDRAFYAEKGYQAPRRCKNCRDKRKAGGGGGGGGSGGYGGGGGGYGGGGGGYGGGGGGYGGSSGGGGYSQPRQSSYGGGGGGGGYGGGGNSGGGGGGYGGGRGGAREQREMFKTVCSVCNQETEVPFKPNGARPVYCRACWNEKKKSGMA